jgi:hypothetical protein
LTTVRTNLLRIVSLAIAAAAFGAVDSDGATPPGGIRLRALLQPPEVVPGGTAEFSVTFDLPPGWIVYDLEQPPASVLPTQLELEPTDWIGAAESFRSEGALERAEPRFGDRIARYFDQSPTFRRPVLVSLDAPLGAKSIRGRARFLVKNEVTGLFYLVTDAPFEATLTIVATTEGPEELAAVRPESKTASRADSIPIESPPPAPRKTSAPYRFQVDSAPWELRPSSPDPPLFPPILLGVLLVFSGIGLASCIPPRERSRAFRAASERLAA